MTISHCTAPPPLTGASGWGGGWLRQVEPAVTTIVKIPTQTGRALPSQLTHCQLILGHRRSFDPKQRYGHKRFVQTCLISTHFKEWLSVQVGEG